MLLGQFLYKMCLATFAVTYDALQSATKREETDGVNDKEDEMQKTEKITLCQ